MTVFLYSALSVPENVHSTPDMSQDERDCEILQSILDDGHYNDISPEDASALRAVIASMKTSCEQKGSQR